MSVNLQLHDNIAVVPENARNPILTARADALRIARRHGKNHSGGKDFVAILHFVFQTYFLSRCCRRIIKWMRRSNGNLLFADFVFHRFVT